MNLVPLDKLSDAWDECSTWIAAAIEHAQGDENLTDVIIALARGVYALWWEPGECAAITMVMRYPRQTVCTVVYAGGKLDALQRAHEFGRVWCREQGISVLRMYGRPGWTRELPVTLVGVLMQEILV